MHHDDHTQHDPVPIIFTMEQGQTEGPPLGMEAELDWLTDELWQALTVLKGASQLLMRTIETDRLPLEEREVRLRIFLRNMDFAATEATQLAARLVAMARSALDG